MNSIIERNDDLGKLILRFAVGFLMIFHGFSKVTNGVEGIAGMLQNRGIPEFFAYGVYIGEVIAPIFLIIGYYTRVSAGLIIFTMLTAIFLVHSNELLDLNDHGALKLELIYFYIFTSVSIIFLGSGKFAVKSD